MNGYTILGHGIDARNVAIGAIPPYQVLQQQNAGLPPGSVPPWYAMQYPAGYVPPLLVSVDNPLEEDPFAAFDRAPYRGEREERGLLRSHLLGLAIDEPGYVDALVRDFQAKLDATPVTYAVARVLASRAVAMANDAENIVKSQGSKTLIGPAMYEIPRGHVLWHVENIAKEIAGRDPRTTPYERAEDLKKWAGGCYRARMAASQDRDLREKFTREFWSDLGQVVLDVPENMKKIVRGGAEWAIGPLWIWGLGGALLLGVLGYAAFKILAAAAPVAAARYLP